MKINDGVSHPAGTEPFNWDKLYFYNWLMLPGIFFIVMLISNFYINFRLKTLAKNLNSIDKEKLTNKKYIYFNSMMIFLQVTLTIYVLIYRGYLYSFFVGDVDYNYVTNLAYDDGSNCRGLPFFVLHSYATILLNVILMLPVCISFCYFLKKSYEYLKKSNIDNSYFRAKKTYYFIASLYVLSLLLLLLVPDIGYREVASACHPSVILPEQVRLIGLQQ